MPHVRSRYAVDQIKKKLSFFRVVSLQGARQVGKSFLAREILTKLILHSQYISLDDKMARELAEHNPSSFLEKYNNSHSKSLLAIDEAQKSPSLFDAVKLVVDQYPRPGRYLLLGSTEFSKEAKIRESLTGRMGRVRIFPMTLAESLSLQMRQPKEGFAAFSNSRISRGDLMRYLDHGGFPGIFSLRDIQNQHALWGDWLRLVTERDLLTFRHLKPDPELASDLMRIIPITSEPNATNLAKTLGTKTQSVLKNLKLLENLFVIHSNRPHPVGSGKPQYFLCDVGIHTYLGGGTKRALETWLTLEQLAYHSYVGDGLTRSFYYRSARGGILDLILDHPKKPLVAIKMIAHEGYDKRDFEILKAFKNKMKNANRPTRLIALAPVTSVQKDGDIEIYPWESIA